MFEETKRVFFGYWKPNCIPFYMLTYRYCWCVRQPTWMSMGFMIIISQRYILIIIQSNLVTGIVFLLCSF